MSSDSIISVSNRVIRFCFMLLFFLVPLILTPWNYELFEYNKMIVTYGLTIAIVGAWVVKMIAQKEIKIAKTPLDIPILLFVTSQLVSSLFSIDPHVSWFGYYSRSNGGMWSVISYALLYFAFTSNFMDKSSPNTPLSTVNSPLSTSTHVTLFLKILLASATTVALYGVAEHFGIDKHLWVQDVQNRVFSTLGQPNWLAAFLVALLPVSMAMAVKQVLTNNQPLFNRGKQSAMNNQQSTISNFPLNPDIGHWLLRFSIWTGITLLFFVTLLFTRSRSGLLAFAVTDVVFWITTLFLFYSSSKREVVKKNPQQNTSEKFSLARSNNKTSTLLLPFFIVHCTFFITIFINGTHIDAIDKYVTFKGIRSFYQQSTINNQQSPTESTPSGTLLETGGTESGTIRKYVWQGAIAAWQSTQKTWWIGTGTETFYAAFYQFRPKEHNMTSEWDFLYNKAHNEYLNYLATTGVLGLGSYLLFILVFIGWFVKMLNDQCQMLNKKINEKSNSLDIGHWTLVIGLFAGWLSLLITNFFGFSVVIVQIMFFLFPAIMIILVSNSRNQSNAIFNSQLSTVNCPPSTINFPLPHSPLLLNASSLTIVLATLILLLSLATRWYADTLFARGYRLSRAGRIGEAEYALRQATAIIDDEPFYFDELGATQATLSLAALEQNDATQSAQLAEASIKASTKALSIAPRNVNYWKSRTKIYYTFAAIDPKFTEASIDTLTTAAMLSPQDPKILYNLAVLYGKADKNDKAIETLVRAIDLKPNYRDAYIALSIFYKETKKKKESKEVLETYLTNVDPNDTEVQERLKE